MATRLLSGTRIRQLRRKKGVKQAVLATKAGISASYLNLIEHNRRAPSENALESIANALGVPARALTDDADAPIKAELRDIAREHMREPPEAEQIDELTVRFPQWAALISAQARQMRDQEAIIATLNDRYNFDPRLQASLHEMLSTVTAIRSTASILSQDDAITDQETRRFQSNIHETSIRLSDAVSGLVSYFDAASAEPKSAATPQEEFELFLEANDHVFEQLEHTDRRGAQSPEQIVSSAPMLTVPESQSRALHRLTQYQADARAMPLEAFTAEAQKLGYAPDRLAHHFDIDVHAVFRRLAVLRREGIDAPAFGLVIINAAGLPIYRRPLKEFSLPRFVSICAYWPVFAALSAPGQPMEDILELPDGREFFARTLAQPLQAPTFGQKPSFASAMIVTGADEAFQFGMLDRTPKNKVPVGSSCRLCERQNCPARAEPALTQE